MKKILLTFAVAAVFASPVIASNGGLKQEPLHGGTIRLSQMAPDTETMDLRNSREIITLEHVAKLNASPFYKLKELDLEESDADNTWVEYLLQFKGLTKLNLANTTITDKGVSALVDGLPKLMSIDVSGTEYSGELDDELKELRSGLSIIYKTQS